MLRIVTDPVGDTQNPLPAFGSRERRTVRGWEGHQYLRCRGRPVFRNSYAVDLALILDLDPEVEEWECVPDPIELYGENGGSEVRIADFRVRRVDGSIYHLDADGTYGRRPVDRSVEYVVASHLGLLDDTIVRNARGIAAYAEMAVPIPDQVRLLTLLDDLGSVILSEAIQMMRESGEPVGAVMALTARRVVRLDWISAVVGPRTQVERFQSRRPILPRRIAASDLRSRR